MIAAFFCPRSTQTGVFCYTDTGEGTDGICFLFLLYRYTRISSPPPPQDPEIAEYSEIAETPNPRLPCRPHQ
jgi:hypothetical protein